MKTIPISEYNDRVSLAAHLNIAEYNDRGSLAAHFSIIKFIPGIWQQWDILLLRM